MSRAAIDDARGAGDGRRPCGVRRRRARACGLRPQGRHRQRVAGRQARSIAGRTTRPPARRRSRSESWRHGQLRLARSADRRWRAGRPRRSMPRAGRRAAAARPCHRRPARTRATSGAGCVVVLATDAPLLPQQLTRLARRAGLGLARTGSTAGHGSGEIFLAFSTGYRIRRGPVDAAGDHDPSRRRAPRPLLHGRGRGDRGGRDRRLFVADTVHGRDGRVVPGLPVERTLDLLRLAGRLA